MERLRTRLLCIPAAMLLAVCSARAQYIAAKADAYMQASVKVDHFMGSVLIAQGGKVLLSKGYGAANIELGAPNTPETEFRIGSNTKQFTAMAILELQQRGKLGVQDPICKYVPNCPEDWAPITISNLLTHTSGIPNFTSFPGYLKVSSQPMTPAALLALFENKPLDFKPGEKFSYSNSGYIVLGYIIQKVSGESYARFLQQNIFGPLGMTHTGYDSNHPAGPDHAQGYAYTGNGFVKSRYIDMSVPFSAGALYSTVLDLYKWDRSLTTDKLVSQKTLAAMFTPYVSTPSSGFEPAGSHYGYGWFISTVFSRKEIWHEGGISGFTSFNGWFPDDRACVIVLDNTTSPHVFAISRALAAILFGQKYKTPHERTAISLPPAALKPFIGRYQLAPAFIISVTLEGDQLVVQGSGQPPAAIYPESKTEFFYKVVDAQITFVQNPQGKTTGIVVHQNGRNLPAKKISAETLSLPKSIALPSDILQTYVGQYQLWRGFVITVTREGDQLIAQASGQPAAAIYPESKTEFFYKAVDAQITFVQNAQGKTTGLILHQNGRNLSAPKIR